MLFHKNRFQIPFPVIDFCPDLDHVLLSRYLGCLYINDCGSLDRHALLSMMTTIRAGVQMCESRTNQWIENNFVNELVRSDYKNMSFADHLEHFLNPNWTEENSFCMDGGQREAPTQVLVKQSGLCFILNSKENIYSQR